MSLRILAAQYRESAAKCKERALLLRERLQNGEMGETERMLLRRRVNMLVTMASETAATARYLKNYYGRTDEDGDDQPGTGNGVSEPAGPDETLGAGGRHGPDAGRGAA